MCDKFVCLLCTCAGVLHDSKDFTAVSKAAFNGSADIVAMLIRVGR